MSFISSATSAISTFLSSPRGRSSSSSGASPDPTEGGTPGQVMVLLDEYLESAASRQGNVKDYKKLVKECDGLLSNFLIHPNDPSFALSKQSDIYHRMRHYHLISAALDRRMRPVSSAPWDVVAQDGNVALAAQVRDMIKRIPRFQQARKGMLDAVFQGVSFSELRWPWKESEGEGGDESEEDDGKLSTRHAPPMGQRIPTTIRLRNKQLFRFHEKTGKVVSQGMWTYGSDGKGIDDECFVIHTHGAPEEQNTQERYDARYGRGLADDLYYPWFWANLTFKRLMTILDRSGLVPIVSTLPNANKDEVAKAMEQMAYFTGKGVLFTPAGVKIELRDIAPQVFTMFMKFIAYLDDAVAKVVLGAPLAMNPRDGGGSRAEASVNLDALSDAINEDARELDETITNQLIGPLIKYNVPSVNMDHPDFILPRFTSTPRHPEDRNATFQRMMMAGQNGLKISMKALRERFDLPAPDPDDPEDSWPPEQMMGPPQGGGQGQLQSGMGGGQETPAPLPLAAPDEQEEVMA